MNLVARISSSIVKEERKIVSRGICSTIWFEYNGKKMALEYDIDEVSTILDLKEAILKNFNIAEAAANVQLEEQVATSTKILGEDTSSIPAGHETNRNPLKITLVPAKKDEKKKKKKKSGRWTMEDIPESILSRLTLEKKQQIAEYAEVLANLYGQLDYLRRQRKPFTDLQNQALLSLRAMKNKDKPWKLNKEKLKKGPNSIRNLTKKGKKAIKEKKKKKLKIKK